MSLTRTDILDMTREELVPHLDSIGIQYSDHTSLHEIQQLYLEHMEASTSESCEQDKPSQDEVQQMDMFELSQRLDEANLVYDHLESLQEMQELYTKHLYEKPSDTSHHQQHHTKMEDIVDNDRKMRLGLSAIYDMLKEFLNKSKYQHSIKSIMNAMNREFNIERLTSRKDELMDDCPIVVAGETSAGKSSLLNLILGTDVLAQSLLGTTSTICRLHNSDTKYFDIHLDNDTVERVDRPAETWKDALEPYVTSRNPACKQVDVYWPIPMLKQHVTIVDTPGIGENDALTDTLLSYLPKAIAFIYVINSANAGGFKEDNILSIQRKQWAKMNGPMTIDYESTVFVCNKWDRVQDESEKVWEDTQEKILETLPGFPVEQIYRISVAEEERRRKSKLGMTSNFSDVMKGIERLVAISLGKKIRTHYSWIEEFLKNIRTQILSRINQGNKTIHDRKKQMNEASEQIDKLRKHTDEVQNNLLKAAKQECLQMENKLHDYLHTEDVRQKVLSWDESNMFFIDSTLDLKTIRFQAERVIQARIKDVFKDWETGTKIVKDVCARLQEMLQSEHKRLTGECEEINLLIMGEKSFRFSPAKMSDANDIQQKTTMTTDSTHFSTKENVLIAVTSPIWFPLVAAASILLLPVAAGMVVHESTKHKRFMKKKARFMREWTQEAIDKTFSKTYIQEFISKVYYTPFRNKIDTLCVDMITKRVDTHRQLIVDIEHDERSSKDIDKYFKPLLVEIRMLLEKQQQLRHFDLLEAETKLELAEHPAIHHGQFYSVFRGRWTKNDDTKTDVAVKVFNEITNTNVRDTLRNLYEVACLRNLKHPNIVEVYSICCTLTADNNDKKLALITELCEGNLEDMVFKNTNLQCWFTDTHEVFTFYLRMAIGICKGLAEIHQHGYKHRNLKLPNVLVKHQTAKLCYFSLAQPEDFSHDIYRLGILLWELWYGRNVSTDCESRSSCGILHALKSDVRPKMTHENRPPSDLQALIRDCWDRDPTKRPRAHDVGTRLVEFMEDIIN